MSHFASKDRQYDRLYLLDEALDIFGGKAAALGIGVFRKRGGKLGGEVAETAGEIVLKDFNQARNEALEWLEERGFKVTEPNIGGVRATEGKAVGMKGTNAEGKTSGFRVEYDERNGAHINVFSGKEKGPHFRFNATEQTVNKIQRKYESR